MPYGADMGGCLPVGDLTYTDNYFNDPTSFFGSVDPYKICTNPPYVPSSPVNITMSNIGITSADDVPSYILQDAGPK